MKRILSLCCAVLLLAGCADPFPDTYIPTGDGLTWDDGQGGTAQTPEVDDQVLTLTYNPDKGFNPIGCIDFTNRALFSLIYQSLFVYDRDYNVEPLLCHRYSRSADMKTYVFYLEENATFSDGTKVTAEDVVASFRTASINQMYSGRFQQIASYSVTADGGVQVKTKVAMENLPLLLDIPIIPQSQQTEVRPIGSGPYVLDETTGTLRLRRRSDWWCQADLLVTAPSVSLVKSQNITQVRDLFQFGDLSLALSDPGSDKYHADFRNDYELWDMENGIFVYLACNMESGLFTNATLRSALTYAIDRDMLAQDYYRGFARSATLPASPLSPYYNKGLAQKYGYDAIKFAEAVEATGKQGTEVVLLLNRDDSLRLRVGKAIAQMLEDCGLKVKVEEKSTTEYLKALRNRSYDLYLGQTRLTATMDLSAFFSASGSLNYGALGDVALYSLCQQALANYGNYYTLHKAVMDDGRLCPIVFRSYAVYAKRGELTGLSPARDNVFRYSLGKTMEQALITN